MSVLEPLHFYSAILRTSTLEQPSIIILGQRTHLDTQCSGNSWGVSLGGQDSRPLNSVPHWVAFLQVNNSGRQPGEYLSKNVIA